MDIKKLTHPTNGNFSERKVDHSGTEAPNLSSKRPVDNFFDKVSIENYSFRNNDQLFGKLELEKLNQSASNRLKDLKMKLSEYQEAKEISPEAARETEIGQKLNDPSVWADIADKMLS